MSAELLRRAAALMRERAEKATPGPWINRRGPGEHVLVVNGTVNVETSNSREDRRHIASWHPDVALAVADWLDAEAEEIPPHVTHYRDGLIDDAPAFKVARAYLGEPS